MAEAKPGNGVYTVAAAVAVVRLLDGSERYVYRRGRFDAAGADSASVDHLESSGLITKVAVEAAPAASGEEPKSATKTTSRTTK